LNGRARVCKFLILKNILQDLFGVGLYSKSNSVISIFCSYFLPGEIFLSVIDKLYGALFPSNFCYIISSSLISNLFPLFFFLSYITPLTSKSKLDSSYIFPFLPVKAFIIVLNNSGSFYSYTLILPVFKSPINLDFILGCKISYLISLSGRFITFAFYSWLNPNNSVGWSTKIGFPFFKALYASFTGFILEPLFPFPA